MKFPFQQDEPRDDFHGLGAFLIGIGPACYLIHVRSDAGKLADAFFFQWRLPQPIVESALPEEVGNSLPLSESLALNELFFVGRNAHFYPRAAPFFVLFHVFSVSGFQGFEGGTLASPVGGGRGACTHNG